MSLAFSECTKCKRNKVGYICSWGDKFNYNCKNFTPKEKKKLADEMKQLADSENGNDFYSSLKKQIRKNALNGKYYIRVFKKDINENIRQKLLEDGFKIEELAAEELHGFLDITWR